MQKPDTSANKTRPVINGVISNSNVKVSDNKSSNNTKSAKSHLFTVFFRSENKLRFYLFRERPKEISLISGNDYTELIDDSGNSSYVLENTKKNTEEGEDDLIGTLYSVEDKSGEVYHLINSIVDRSFFDKYDADPVLAPFTSTITTVDSVIIETADLYETSDDEEEDDDEDDDDDDEEDDEEDEEEKDKKEKKEESDEEKEKDLEKESEKNKGSEDKKKNNNKVSEDKNKDSSKTKKK